MPPPTRAADYRTWDRLRINESYPVSPTRAVHYLARTVNSSWLADHNFSPSRRPSFGTFLSAILRGRGGYSHAIPILQAFQRGEAYGSNPPANRTTGAHSSYWRTSGSAGSRTYRFVVGGYGNYFITMIMREGSSFSWQIGITLFTTGTDTDGPLAQTLMKNWVLNPIGVDQFYAFSSTPRLIYSTRAIEMTFRKRSSPSYYWIGTTSSQLRDGDGATQSLRSGIDDGDSVNEIARLLTAVRHTISLPAVSDVTLKYIQGETKTYSRTLPVGTVTPSGALPAGAHIDYSLTGLATGMTFNATTRTLSFSYGKDAVAKGTYTFSYRAEIDSYPDVDPSDTESFTITINEEIPDLLPEFAACTPTGGV